MRTQISRSSGCVGVVLGERLLHRRPPPSSASDRRVERGDEAVAAGGLAVAAVALVMIGMSRSRWRWIALAVATLPSSSVIARTTSCR